MRVKASFLIWLLCVLFLLVERSNASPHTQTPEQVSPLNIIYVDDDADGFNIGTSWEHAVNSLQDALLLAYFSDKPVEIQVAQGIYTPDRGLGIMPGDREASFQLIDGVIVKGGFAGVGAPDPDIRDIELYEAILSGDLNGDDMLLDDLRDVFFEPTRKDNCFHVVTINKNGPMIVIDGFTISKGNAYTNGGGMLIECGNPTVSNCTFVENSASHGNGGGMCSQMSSPALTNCIFRRNIAVFGGGMACGGFGSPIIVDCIISENLAMQTGGGIGCGRDSSPTINNCTISGNTAISDGGGIFSLDSNATITNCTISENWSWLYGGGIFCEYLQPVITNCLISGNWAFIGGGGIDCFVSNPTITNCTISNNTSISYHGGGIYCGSSSAKIMNCTISGNSAYLNGGGVHCHGGGQGSKNVEVTNCTFGLNSASRDGSSISCESSTIMMVRNCILWGDLASQGAEIFIGGGFSSLSISYSNVQGGQSGSQVYVNNALIWGDGNIDADPFFTDPENEDYHLKSQAGRWDPTSESWIIDDVTSPCIDAGDPNNPVGLEPMPNGGIINIGAYGGTEQASKSSELKSLLLPYVGFIFSSDVEIAESFKSLLEAYSCAVDLIGLDELAQSTLVDYDLIIVGNDTGRLRRWGDILSAAVIESSGNPIIGLGEGGYAFFGKLELSIGYPHGWHGDNNSVYIVPYRTLEDMPYPISLPLDRVLQLYTETRHVGIYLPSIPEDVITIGREAGNRSHYPFVLEDNRYFLWGFSGPPESMTESGKLLFINTIILTANVAWDIESREQHMSQEVFK